MVKQTTSTTITCRVPIPSCDHDILTVIGQLTDKAAVLKFEASGGAGQAGAATTSSSSTLPVMTIKSTNAFTKKTTESSAVSLLGCVRNLSQHSENLWDAGNGAQGVGQVESWIQSTEETLLPITRKPSGQGELLLETVQDYLGKIAAHLEQSQHPYLVGEAPTVADVCVALPVVTIALKHFKEKLVCPSKVMAWMESVLGQVESVVELDKATWKAWKELKGDTAAASSPAAAVVSPSAAATSSSGDNLILNLLQEQKVEYSLYDHPESKTAEELVVNAPLPDGETHTKNLFLRDKKHGLFLVTVATNAKVTTAVQTKELGKLLGLSGKVNLRMADAGLLLEYLHVTPGCVGPLCAAIAKADGDEKVQLVLDESLVDNKTYSKIHSHPMRNDQSVSMTPDAFLACLKAAGVEPTVLAFGSAAPAPAGGGGGDAKQKQKPSQEPKKKGEKKPQEQQSNKKTGKKGETLLALQWKKDENFAQWYTDVIVLSEMISYYDISGCYILRPWSYTIWELMQEWFNVEVSYRVFVNARLRMYRHCERCLRS